MSTAPLVSDDADLLMIITYLEGRLSRPEAEKLNLKLEQSELLRRDFAELLLQQIHLHELGQEKRFIARFAEKPSPAPLGSALRSVAAQVRSLWTLVRCHPGFAVASTIILVTALLIPTAARSSFNTAQLQEVEGTVLLKRATQLRPASNGTAIRAGDELILQDAGGATLAFQHESTKIRLAQSAQIRIDSSAHGKLLFLKQGSLTAQVAPQKPSAPMRVRTSDAEAIVRGTEFALETSTESTRLEVWQGKVELAKPADGTSTVVSSGHFAIATKGLPLRAEATQGGVLREAWHGIKGNRVGDLTSNPAFPNSPNERGQLPSLESEGAVGEQYGARLRGWLHVPKTGKYQFAIAADDQAELWLSSNENPQAKVRICYTPDYTNVREWNKYREQTSSALSLEAGRQYYLEVLFKQEAGGESLSVAWQGPDIPLDRVPSQCLSPYRPLGSNPLTKNQP